MRIVQGIVLGLFIWAGIILLAFGVYLYFVHPLGTTAFVSLALYNWLFWAALVASLTTGVTIARRWPKVQH
jgi:hypothetical protein